MDRRTFLSGAGVVAASAASACAQQEDKNSSPAAPMINRNQVKKLRMVTTWPKGFPGLGEAAERAARFMGELSGRSLQIEVLGAGEFVSAYEVFDAVSNGAADMYHGAEYYWQGRSPAYNFYCSVPFGLTASEIMGWIDFGGGQSLWDKLSGQFNLIAFQAGNTGHQMGGWFKREINSLNDFRGLRVRMPGLGGEVIRQMGGAAVSLSGGEIYQALQSGTIDATEWVGPWNDLAFGFYREAPFYYGPGFHEPGAALAVGINRSVWDNLTTDHKAIVKASCRACNNLSIGEFHYQNGIALNTLRVKHNVQLRQFSDEIFLEMGKISEQVVADAANNDELTRRTYQSYLKAREYGRNWATISDAPYYNYRERVLRG